MNHYIRTIGSVLILVYNMLAAFLFIDKVLVNIICLQGVSYTQIFGIPVFLFLNLIIILLCVTIGSVLACRISQQNGWTRTQIERSMGGETTGINDRNIEIYSETLDLYHALVSLDRELHRLRLKIQNPTNENYNINDVKVKKIIEDERQRLVRELYNSISQRPFMASIVLSTIKETKLEPPLDQQIPILEKVVQDLRLEMCALLLHLRPLGLEDKSLGESIEDLVIDLQKKVPMRVVHEIQGFKVPKDIEDHSLRITQGTISNILRHSNGIKVTVELFNKGDYLLLRIQDNGKGLNADEELEQSYGFKNMCERALKIGATFHIVSLPGSGTRIEMEAPLNKEDSYDD